MERKMINYTTHIDDFLYFLFSRDKKLYWTCAHMHSVWQAALQFYHGEPWEQESFLCKTMTGRKLCLWHLISLLRWPQLHTHLVYTNSIPSAWLPGLQRPTPALTAFSSSAVWPDGSWICNHCLYILASMLTYACMIRLYMTTTTWLTLWYQSSKIIPQPPPGLNTLDSTW